MDPRRAVSKSGTHTSAPFLRWASLLLPREDVHDNMRGEHDGHSPSLVEALQCTLYMWGDRMTIHVVLRPILCKWRRAYTHTHPNSP